MVTKSTHPTQLFDYLNGAVDGQPARVIEGHLSLCEECASVAAMVRALKEAASERRGGTQESKISHLKSEDSNDHPDVGELADFYHTRSRRADSRIAGHAALCRSCAEAVEQYARGERAASEYDPSGAVPGEVPAKAWEMIRDWEESSYAKLKPASEVLGHDLLKRLSGLLGERAREIREADATKAERVPVLVVSGSGEVRSVEFFEKSVDSTGASVLRHADGSERFDNKMLHVLLHYGEREPIVISDLICRSTIRLQPEARPEEKSARVDYFIVED